VCKGVRKKNEVKGRKVRWCKVRMCEAIHEEVGVCIVSVCEVLCEVLCVCGYWGLRVCVYGDLRLLEHEIQVREITPPLW
jgi:hypothetical protein